MFARRSVISWCVLFAFCAFAVHLLKFDARDVHRENVALQKAIREEQLALELLEAEWVYLSRPQRLEVLAKKYLPVRPLRAADVIAFDAIKSRALQQASLESR